MFIINPYRYAATEPPPITEFWASIHTSSLDLNIGLVGPIYSSNIHSSSVEFALGVIFSPISMSDILTDSVEFSVGPTGAEITISDQLIDTIEIIVT